MSKLKKALDKAKEARGRVEEEQVKERPAASAPGRIADDVHPGRGEINPTYVSTRIVSVDAASLRKKKIVSLCHENKMADQIKILRAQILKTMSEVGGNSLLVTSANEGEGKTLTAINLALSICQELDRTVLLVDANLRGPSIHRYFELDGASGLSEYLKNRAGIENVLINPGIPRLTILPAGKPSRNSSELLGSPRTELLVKEMKDRYPERFIIFDSSSLLSSADPLVFSKFVDGVLLVVEAEKTSTGALSRALDLLKDSPIVGTVLNKAKG